MQTSSEEDLLLVVGGKPQDGLFNSRQLCPTCCKVRFPEITSYNQTRFIAAWAGWRDEIRTPNRDVEGQIARKHEQQKRTLAKQILDDFA